VEGRTGKLCLLVWHMARYMHHWCVFNFLSPMQVAIMIGSSVFSLLCKKFTVESFMRLVSFLFFVKMCISGIH